MRSLDIPEGDESAGGAPGAGFKKIDNFLTDQPDACYGFSESDDERRSRFFCADRLGLRVQGRGTDSEMAPQAVEIA
jgi:hypothetical protein